MNTKNMTNEIQKIPTPGAITLNDVQEKIITIRDRKVILDSDVAWLYGVETMRVNEAVKNNPDKFPEGYILELSKEEKAEVIEIFDNPKIKFSPALPKAFTKLCKPLHNSDYVIKNIM